MQSTPRTIRLFVPTGVYPPDIGGPATYVPLIEKYLPGHGFKISVLPFSEVKHLPKGISHLVYFFHCVSFSLRADVVYAQDAVSVGWPARLAALITFRPFIVKIVGDHVWEQGSQRFSVRYDLDDFPLWPTNIYLFFLRILQQAVVRSARKIIVPSVYLRSVVRKWGIANNEIAVIYNGVEIPVIIKEPKEEIKRPLIVSAGRLTPWKGFKGLMDAVCDEESWNLVIVGDGPDREVLEAYAKKKGIEEKVHFTGSLPREELHGWIKTADVFVNNSTYEGLPHLLVEALALGTPSVVSDISGNKEVIQSDEALVVSAHDSNALRLAIFYAVNKKGEMKDRAEAGKKRAEEFSVSQTISGLAQILRDVCA